MKMILLLVSVMVLLLSIDIHAQPQYFQRIYSTSNKFDTYFYDIKSSGNSDYILTGYTDLFNPLRYGLYILKINNYGIPIWSKTISSLGSGYIGYNIVKKNDNYIIVGTSDTLYILSIDSEGNEIWFKKYFQAEYKLNNLIKTNDNGFIACGSINARLGFIVKFDSLGNLLWNKTYPSGYFRNFVKILEFNKIFYVIGVRNDSSTDNGKPVITKLNSNGDIMDEKKYNFPNLSVLFKDLTIKNNIITIFCGRTDLINLRSRNFITKVNLDLEILDTLTIQYPNPGLYNDIFQRMVPYKENKYILQSFIGDSTVNGFKLLDSNFQLLNYKNISTSTNLLGLFAAPDNSIFSIGVYDVDTIATELGYINKMDSNFYSGTQLINIKNENLTVNNFTLHQNYPNPFNPSTKISYSLKKSSSIELKLFDINGRMIKIIESGFKPAGFYEINFSAEGLSSGVYFFSLYSEGILIDTKKAVILK